MNGVLAELPLVLAGRWPFDATRLGFRTPLVTPGSVWLHGASLGEAKVARGLAEHLAPAFVTTDTRAGGTWADFLRPLDHPWILAPLWAEARPRLVVMVESSWWPALGALARRNGVPVIGVGVRSTPGVHRRFRWLGGPDAVFAQTAEDAAQLARVTEVLGVSGTCKHGDAGPSPLTWETPFLVAVSAREGDCEALIQARNTAFPGHSLLLAPRHVGPIPDTGRTVVRRSSGIAHVPSGTDLWLDTHGELASCLHGASAALIGGTFDPRIGGHSPVEALCAGVPVVHGPEIAANRSDFVGTVLADDPTGLSGALGRALATVPAPRQDERPRVAAALEARSRVSKETSPRPWLRAFAPLQRWGIRRHRTSVRPWVIAVGSRNARGCGKTSTAAFIADELRARGVSVRIVTRGTGRRAEGVGDSAIHGPDPWWLGDEGAVLALAGHRVVAHPDRLRALRSTAADVVLLEDGLFANVRADVRVEALDARFPTGRGVQPAGEARSDALVCDVTVAHHGSERFPVPAGALPAIRTPGVWSRAIGSHVAFSGIGRPADFFATLPEAEAVEGFADHAWYDARCMERLLTWAGARTLVTTDRDWVRVHPAYREQVVWRGIHVDVPALDLGRLLP